VSGLFQTGKAHAIDTGNKLLSQCESELGGANQIYCMGLLDGFSTFQLQMNQFDFFIMKNNKFNSVPKICSPIKITMGQVEKMVIKWLNDHPERLHEYVAILVMAAYRELFPCEAKEMILTIRPGPLLFGL
jgi:hypothetical protein